MRNAPQLVTGYDLHSTLSHIIRSDGVIKSTPPSKQPGVKWRVPPWSYDLLTEIIPNERTCDDAFVPLDHCACVNEYLQVKDLRGGEGTPHAPRDGICNYLTDGIKNCLSPEFV